MCRWARGDSGPLMMELAHSLLLNEEALRRVPESKRPVFVFEWLRFLDKVLAAAQKVLYSPRDATRRPRERGVTCTVTVCHSFHFVFCPQISGLTY